MEYQFNQKFSVGEIFRIIRIVNRLRQHEVSQLIGVSQGYMSKVERGEYLPDIDVAIRFSKEFNFTLDAFAYGFIPGVSEGLGMHKLIPIKYRENSHITLGAVSGLLFKYEQLTERGGVEKALKKMGVKMEVFALPDVKINQVFLNDIEAILKSYNSVPQVEMLNPIGHNLERQ